MCRRISALKLQCHTLKYTGFNNEIINGCIPFRWLMSLTWDTLVEAIFDVIGYTCAFWQGKRKKQGALVRPLLGKMWTSMSGLESYQKPTHCMHGILYTSEAVSSWFYCDLSWWQYISPWAKCWCGEQHISTVQLSTLHVHIKVSDWPACEWCCTI